MDVHEEYIKRDRLVWILVRRAGVSMRGQGTGGRIIFDGGQIRLHRSVRISYILERTKGTLTITEQHTNIENTQLNTNQTPNTGTLSYIYYVTKCQ